MATLPLHQAAQKLQSQIQELSLELASINTVSGETLDTRVARSLTADDVQIIFQTLHGSTQAEIKSRLDDLALMMEKLLEQRS